MTPATSAPAGHSGTPLAKTPGHRPGDAAAHRDAPAGSAALVRAVALPAGLIDVEVCAIDATWSALELVVRKDPR